MGDELDILSQEGITLPGQTDILSMEGIENPNASFLGQSEALDWAAGLPETALAFGTALPAMAAGGIYGLAKGAVTGDPREIAMGSMEATEALRYKPMSVYGQNNMAAFEELLKPYEEAKIESGRMLGDRFSDNPFVAGTLDQTFNIAETLLTMKAGQAAFQRSQQRIAEAPKVLSPQEIKQITLQEGLAHESLYDVQLATEPYVAVLPDGTKVTTGKKGDLIPDDKGKALYEQYGIPQGDIAFFKISGANDLEIMRQMLDIYRGNRETTSGALNGRYIDPIGEVIASQVEYLDNIRRTNGKALDKLVEGKMGQRTINVMPIMNQWLAQVIKSLNIKNVSVKEGMYKLDYNNSLLEGNNASQAAINRVVARLNQGEFTAKDLHFLKKYVDENIDWSKPGRAGEQGGISTSTENLFKTLRGQINAALQAEYPQYGRINGTLEKIYTALTPLNSALTKEYNLLDPAAVRQLAIAMRRISSNAKSGASIDEGITLLNNLVNELGGEFSVDPKTLQNFAQIVEKRFGSEAENSLMGTLDKANRQSAADVAGAALAGLATGGKSSMLRGIKNIWVGKEASDKQALAALRAYLIDQKKKAQQRGQ